MSPKQMFEACRTLAPNFRVEIRFTTLPTVSRIMEWSGQPTWLTHQLSAGVPFPESAPFESLYAQVLQSALAVLSNA